MGKKKGGVVADSAATVAAMKKKGSSAAAGTSTAAGGKKKVVGTRVTNGVWRPSIIKASDLRLLRQDGVISAAVADARVPSGETISTPPLVFE